MSVWSCTPAPTTGALRALATGRVPARPVTPRGRLPSVFGGKGGGRPTRGAAGVAGRRQHGRGQDPRSAHQASTRRSASSSPSGPSSRRASSSMSSASPTTATRPDAQQLHDAVAVDVGADGVERLALAQLGDAGLERVHAGGQHARLALVAGRAVAAGQLVEVLEQRPGVAGVAAHGGVAPHVGPVAVEAQVEEHQPAHVVDHVLGEPQRPHAVGGHPRPHHLVVVEAHALRSDRARSWACRRRGAARRAARSAGARSWPRRRSCAPARPCAGGSGPARGASPAARAGTRRTARCRRGTTAPRSGRRPPAASTARRGRARPRRSRGGPADPRPPRPGRRRGRGRSRR